MPEPPETNGIAPDWWPVAAQEAWVCDSDRLFAREEQGLIVEAALVNAAGRYTLPIAKPCVEMSLLKKVARNPYRPHSQREETHRVSLRTVNPEAPFPVLTFGRKRLMSGFQQFSIPKECQGHLPAAPRAQFLYVRGPGLWFSFSPAGPPQGGGVILGR